jgi:hypothetical protein
MRAQKEGEETQESKGKKTTVGNHGNVGRQGRMAAPNGVGARKLHDHAPITVHIPYIK